MLKMIKQFTQHMREKGLKESTIQSYLQDLRLLIFHMESETPADVTEKELRGIVEKLQSKKKESSIMRWVIVTRHFFDFCVLCGLREDNPAQKIQCPRPPRKKRTSPPVGEAEALLNKDIRYFSFLEYRNRALLAIICGSQIKIQEVCTLTIGSFDPVSCQLRLPSGKVYTLGDWALKYLHEYLTFFVYRKTTANTLLFEGQNGRPLTRQSLWKIFKTASEKAGLDSDLSPVKMRGALIQAALNPSGEQPNVSTS
ncbi:MAG: site-specific integrase [Oscillospiraceae bacterium]|nr:site-specific integrase [Oscillospiraceae bacterium]